VDKQWIGEEKMKCIYCNNDFYIGNFNDNVCDNCARERSHTHNTSQPIILARVDFSTAIPTAEEICDMISKLFEPLVHITGTTVYQNNAFYWMNKTICYIDDYTKYLVFTRGLPPSLIVIIGRFYEALDKAKKCREDDLNNEHTNSN
jgi:hypothetical protein